MYMIKKSFVLGLLICSFLLSSSLLVTAADNEKTIYDDVGDVVDYDGNNITRDDIDIKEVFCSQDGRDVTIKLTVVGNIKNQGDINLYRIIIDEDFYNEYTKDMTDTEILELLESMLENDIVSYSFELYSESDSYIIVYVNKELLVLDGNSKTISGSHSTDGETLTISFKMSKSNDQLSDISAIVEESINGGDSSYGDELYGDLFVVDDGDDDDDTGDEDDSDTSKDKSDDDEEGSGLLLFIGLIAVIIVAGVAVLVYAIRK